MRRGIMLRALSACTCKEPCNNIIVISIRCPGADAKVDFQDKNEIEIHKKEAGSLSLPLLNRLIS